MFKILLSLCFTSVYLIAIPTIAATKKTQTSAQIQQQINTIQSKLSKATKQQANLTELLKQAEQNISNITVKINQLTHKSKQQKKQIAELEHQQTSYQTLLDQQKTTLGKLIHNNYLLQHQGKLGIYLSGLPAEETNRYLAYYQSLDNSMITIIDKQQLTIHKLTHVLSNIRSENQQLEKTLKDLTQQKQKITQEQNNRQKIISALDQTIKNNKTQLQQLQSDQTNLTKIVKKIAKNPVQKKIKLTTTKPSIKTTAKTESLGLSQLSFAKQKHQLSWPVKGKLNNLFWTKIDNQPIKWQGDLLTAKTGTEVHSIYTGKVIYADWLRGYGLLIIIDHGNGYLSLYGRNNTLNRAVGDYVNTGDIIATVGNSGGFKTPALYFEIRHNGQALNPKQWIKRS